MMSPPYRIAVAGPGGLGACAIREIQRLPEMELVGVLAYSPEKNGQDAGDLVGLAPIGVRATTNFDEFLKCDAQCVIYTARDFGDWRADAEILALLEAGVNVVTPLPYHYLKVRGEEVEARFAAAASRGGVTLHGSGLSPGYYHERLVPLLTGLSNEVTRVRFQEFFNVESLAGSLETLQLFGFGASLERAEENTFAATMAESYLKQSITFVTDHLGIPIDRIERLSRHRAAAHDIQTPATTIAAGTIGCVSYVWTAFVEDLPFYTSEVNWYLGVGMRPEAAKGDDFWMIEIEGRPSLRVSVESKASFAENLHVRADEPTAPGYLSTVVAMLQSVPAVISAPPGLLSPVLPQFHWKPDQRV